MLLGIGFGVLLPAETICPNDGGAGKDGLVGRMAEPTA